MVILQRVIVFGLYALAAASWINTFRRKERADDTAPAGDDDEEKEGKGHWGGHPRVRVTRESLGNGTEMIRFRGPLGDVMDALHGRAPEEPPALADDIDWRTLPRYYGGCPHCRKRSLYGESLWLYDVVERTREPGDYTTSYLARCKGCKGLMVARIDHED